MILGVTDRGGDVVLTVCQGSACRYGQCPGIAINHKGRVAVHVGLPVNGHIKLRTTETLQGSVQCRRAVIGDQGFYRRQYLGSETGCVLVNGIGDAVAILISGIVDQAIIVSIDSGGVIAIADVEGPAAVVGRVRALDITVVRQRVSIVVRRIKQGALVVGRIVDQAIFRRAVCAAGFANVGQAVVVAVEVTIVRHEVAIGVHQGGQGIINAIVVAVRTTCVGDIELIVDAVAIAVEQRQQVGFDTIGNAVVVTVDVEHVDGAVEVGVEQGNDVIINTVVIAVGAAGGVDVEGIVNAIAIAVTAG